MNMILKGFKNNPVKSQLMLDPPSIFSLCSHRIGLHMTGHGRLSWIIISICTFFADRVRRKLSNKRVSMEGTVKNNI